MSKKKVIKNKTFIFIDSCVFLEVIYSDESSSILDKIIDGLSKNNFSIVLPVVIIKEVEKDFAYWKKDFLETIQKQLKEDFVLGSTQKQNTGSGGVKNKRISTNTVLLNDLTLDNRNKIIKSISDFYDEVEKKIQEVFNHKNTKKIDLTNEIILKGIQRSLLKKAPSIKMDKKTENQHLKDVDCIAFESLISFFENEIVSTNDIIHIVTDDSDYKGNKEGSLRNELVEDIPKFQGKNIIHNTELDFLFSKKSNKIKKEMKQKGTLANNEDGFVESSNINQTL